MRLLAQLSMHMRAYVRLDWPLYLDLNALIAIMHIKIEFSFLLQNNSFHFKIFFSIFEKIINRNILFLLCQVLCRHSTIYNEKNMKNIFNMRIQFLWTSLWNKKVILILYNEFFLYVSKPLCFRNLLKYWYTNDKFLNCLNYSLNC